MLVNGNNDKQLHHKLINVVRLVFLIPLSFTFDNRPRTTAVTFSTLNPRHLSLSVCSVITALRVPVDCFLFGYVFTFCLCTVRAIELDEDRAHAL